LPASTFTASAWHKMNYFMAFSNGLFHI
jgi:hypothetical protein